MLYPKVLPHLPAIRAKRAEVDSRLQIELNIEEKENCITASIADVINWHDTHRSDDPIQNLNVLCDARGQGIEHSTLLACRSLDNVELAQQGEQLLPLGSYAGKLDEVSLRFHFGRCFEELDQLQETAHNK